MLTKYINLIAKELTKEYHAFSFVVKDEIGKVRYPFVRTLKCYNRNVGGIIPLPWGRIKR